MEWSPPVEARGADNSLSGLEGRVPQGRIMYWAIAAAQSSALQRRAVPLPPPRWGEGDKHHPLPLYPPL